MSEINDNKTPHIYDLEANESSKGQLGYILRDAVGAMMSSIDGAQSNLPQYFHETMTFGIAEG